MMMHGITVFDCVIVVLVIALAQYGATLIIPSIVKVDGFIKQRHLAFRITVAIATFVWVISAILIVLIAIPIIAYW